MFEGNRTHIPLRSSSNEAPLTSEMRLELGGRSFDQCGKVFEHRIVDGMTEISLVYFVACRGFDRDVSQLVMARYAETMFSKQTHPDKPKKTSISDQFHLHPRA